MPKSAAARANKRRRERDRLRRRGQENAYARKLDARVTVWFPKDEDKAEAPRPATLDEEILEMQRELLKESE